MRHFIFGLFLVFLSILTTFSQENFDVQNFSVDYYGKVFLEQPNEVFSKGWVAIYQKKTNKLLLKVESEELAVDFDSGKVKTNILQLPYGEQSVIIYDDFNFDGQRDFALMDGQNSCYHGPSFKVFLATKNKFKFIFDKNFTKLAQNNCGMFDVDKDKKQLKTMTKSTCCWHQYSTYIIQNNKPKAVEIIEEQYSTPFVTLDIQTWNGKKMIETHEKSFANPEELNVLFSFKLSNKKEVFLLNIDDELSYNLVNERGYIELSLPIDNKNKETKFVLDNQDNNKILIFKNYGFEYKIYEKNSNEVGIQINKKGFSKTFTGEYDSKKGSLNNLSSEKLQNLELKK